MVWTPPVTRATDDLMTAAEWNAQIVGNLNSILHPAVRKPSDEPIAANTTPQPDDHLLVPVGANETWLTQWYLVFTTPSAAAGLKVQWSFPASGVLQGSWIANTTGATFGNFAIISGTNPTTAQAMGAGAIGSDANTLSIELVYVGAGTAGNLQLLWAQTTSNGTSTVMKENSTVWMARLE